MVIYKFDKDTKLEGWKVVDDVVMGGKSQGSLTLNAKGSAVFRGQISLENNGGFSSVRYRFPTKYIERYDKVLLLVKGDEKTYQFRIKSKRFDRHSYSFSFDTTNVWQTVEIPLSDMSPRFRGQSLNMPNYPGVEMEEIAILVSSKKIEEFRLEISEIKLH